MKVDLFCKEVAFLEGKKKQVDIAQIKETLRCIRQLLNGYVGIDLYKVIRKVGK